MSFQTIHFPGTHSISDRIALAAHEFAKMMERRSAAAAAKRLERARAKDAEALYSLANQYEALSPNLSAELRFLASRG